MPTPTATPMWSSRGEREIVNGSKIDRTISRAYLVVDAPTSTLAKAAIGLPSINAEFEPGSPYRARGRDIQAQRGPTTWEVRVDYSIPDNGAFPTDQIDPLLRPTVLTWGRISAQRAMERDRGDKPALIRNSAGDLYDPAVVDDREFDTLTATKWFPFYDRSLSRNFAECVNAQAYTLQNTTFLPGEILCKRIVPVSSYELTAAGGPTALVQVAAEFWLDSDSRAAANKSGDPFDAHLVDQGLNGWWDDSGTKKRGRFCVARTGDGGAYFVESLVDTPVLLDGTGRPIDTTLKVATKPQVDAPAKVPTQTPDDLKARMTDLPDRVSTFDRPAPANGLPAVRMWRYFKARSANFNDLPY